MLKNFSGWDKWEGKFVQILQQDYWNNLFGRSITNDGLGSSKSPWNKMFLVFKRRVHHLLSVNSINVKIRGQSYADLGFRVTKILSKINDFSEVNINMLLYLRTLGMLMEICLWKAPNLWLGMWIWITILHLSTSTFGKVIFGQETNIVNLTSLMLACVYNLGHFYVLPNGSHFEPLKDLLVSICPKRQCSTGNIKL